MLLASDYDKSKYLKATDLDREKKFRIKSVTAEELSDGKGNKETKLVVWFTNDERGLVLNKTNNRTLRGAFGDDTAGWANKVIAMFPTMVDIRGKMGPPAGAHPAAEAGCSGGSANTASVTGAEMVLRQHHLRRRRLLIRSSSRIRNSRQPTRWTTRSRI